MKEKYTKTQETIAKRLKEKREEKGYTLEEAAKYINVSKVTLHRYENLTILNIPSDKIEILARLYETTPKYIMGWDDEKNTDEIKIVARNEKMISKFDKLSEKKKKIVENLINSYFDEDMEDEEEE